MPDTREVEFTLKLNTPGFIGGAQQGTKLVHFKKADREGNWQDQEKAVPYFPVEPGGIRVPSLRGVLGFWLRSTLAASETGEIFSEQGRTLGSTTRGQGVAIRPCGSEFQGKPLLYSDREVVFERLYLGYGPLQLLKVADPASRQGRRDVATSFNSNACREAILVAPERPVFRFAARGTSQQIQELSRALKLLHAFGGIGARSRRAWGSVEVEAEGIHPVPIHANLTSFFENAVSEVNMPEESPSFSAFSRLTRLFVTSPSDKAEAVLHEFARALLWERSYRAGRPRAVKDHDLEFADSRLSALSAITGIPTRLAFGLPFHPKHGWEIEYRGRRPGSEVSASDGDVTRRSSPLLLKVLRTSDAKYVGVALFLKAQFFGDPSIEVGAKGKKLTLPFGEAEYQVIDEFLDQSGWTEVKI